jgi:hypothetical protein
MRNAVLDVTPLIPATACHQSNDVEPYSRFSGASGKNLVLLPALAQITENRKVQSHKSLIF